MESSRGGNGSRGFPFPLRMLVEDQDAVRRQIVAPGEGDTGEIIVHGFVKLDAHVRILMIEQEENLDPFLLPQADLDGTFRSGCKLHICRSHATRS